MLRLLLPVLLLLGCPSTRVQTPDDSGEHEGDDPGECTDGADNDLDSFFDCDDQECWGSPDCSGDDDDAADDDDTAPDDDDDDDTAPDDDDTAPDDDDSTPPGGSVHLIYANTSSALYSIDPDPPYTATLIGNFTGQALLSQGITDIAIDAAGAMYATGFWEVYRVDPATAALTPLAVDTIPGEVFNALTVRSDGVLVGGGGSTLYEIDPNNGSRSTLTTTSPWTLAGDVVGLPDGLLYALVSSNGDEAAPTSVVTVDVGGDGLQEVGPTGSGAMYGVAYHVPNDSIYGFTQGGQILLIDPSTGAGSVVANTGIPFWGATTNPARWSGR
jgi:hypothetical protein